MSNQITTTQDMEPIKRFELPINVQLNFLKSLPLKTCSDFTVEDIPSFDLSKYAFDDIPSDLASICASGRNLFTEAKLMENFAIKLFEKNLHALGISVYPKSLSYLLNSCNFAYFECIHDIFKFTHVLPVTNSDLLFAIQGLKVVDIDAVDPRALIAECAYNTFSQLTIEEKKQFYSMFSNDEKFAYMESFGK